MERKARLPDYAAYLLCEAILNDRLSVHAARGEVERQHSQLQGIGISLLAIKDLSHLRQPFDRLRDLAGADAVVVLPCGGLVAAVLACCHSHSLRYQRGRKRSQSLCICDYTTRKCDCEVRTPSEISRNRL